MNAPDELLIKTADSIAAGDNVDWHGLHQQAPDPQQSRILTEMQILERIATFLRSSDTDDLSDKPTTQRPKPPMPESWAHFKIVELIGEGGFGSVYRARDTNLQTEVALKLVQLPGGRELRPAGALKEARLLARVRHTNVVTVHGADIVDGRVGIWMQLIEGQTLSTLLRGNGQFGAHEAALIGVDLCRALAAVHAAGLIHGDVKTRNVMREAGGRIVLMDFGTGRDLSALRLHGGRDAAAAGTPLYLAPEVFDGRPQSKVTDTYSLGVLLYHLVTNAYPVKGQTQAEVEEAHRRNERTNLRDARSDLPQSFIVLVERALSRDPADRFQTAGAFETALAGFLGQSKALPQRNLRKGWLNVAAVASVVAAISLAAVWMDRQRTLVKVAPVPPPTVAATPATYQIDTSFYKRGDGGDTRLRAGDRIAPGDALFMKLQVSTPTYIYIVNEDDQGGGSLLLFPLPGQAVANPIAAETTVRVPGTRNEEISWQVSNVGGREHFLVFASPERVTAFEDLFATLPRPVFGKPVSRAERIPTGTISKLRSVGGLTTAPAVTTSANLANVFKTPLGDGPETANGLWVRQLTLDNPPAKR